MYVSKDVICGNGGYSEQTSAGGNERHLLFYARYEET